jgi:hypothetical protein
MNQNNKEEENSEFRDLISYLKDKLSSFDQVFHNAIALQGVEGLIPLGRPERTVRWFQGLIVSSGKELPFSYSIGKGSSNLEKFPQEAQKALLTPRQLVNTIINYSRIPVPNTTENSRIKQLLLEFIAVTILSESYYTQLDDTLVDNPQDLVKKFLEKGISDPETLAELIDAFVPNYLSAGWSINRMNYYQEEIDKFIKTQVDVEIQWSPVFGNLYMSSKNSTSNAVDPEFKFPFDDQEEIENFLKEFGEDFVTEVEDQLEQKKLTLNPKNKIGKSKNKVITKKKLRNPDRFKRTLNPQRCDIFSNLFDVFIRIRSFLGNCITINLAGNSFELNESFKFKNSKQYFPFELIILNISKIFVFFASYLLPLLQFEELKKLFEIWSKMNYYKVNIEKIYAIALGFTDPNFDGFKSAMFAAHIINRINSLIIERTLNFTDLSLVMQRFLFKIMESEYKKVRIKKPLFYIDNGTIIQNIIYIWEQEISDILIYLELVDRKILKLNEKIIFRVQTLVSYFPNLKQHYILTRIFDDKMLVLFMKDNLTPKEMKQILSTHRIGIFSNFQDYKLKTILKSKILNKIIEKIVHNLILAFGIYAVYNLLII